jgi:hypothetical protein
MRKLVIDLVEVIESDRSGAFVFQIESWFSGAAVMPYFFEEPSISEIEFASLVRSFFVASDVALHGHFFLIVVRYD